MESVSSMRTALALFARSPPCQLGFYPGTEHFERKWLGHVIIRAGGKAVNGVGVFHARRQKHDRTGVDITQHAAYRETVYIGKADVKKNDVGRTLRLLERRGTVERDRGKIARHLEIALEHVGNIALIVDDQNERLFLCIHR